jgi:membrane protein YdbS with pleckstrin-like domain
MNPTSALQQQFPLSSKKYWKKMINQIVPMLFADVFLGGMLGGVAIAIVISLGWLTDKNSSGNGIVIVVVTTIVLFIISIFAIHFGIYSWYIKTYIKRYYYAGEENFITIKKGVFAPAEIHVQWQKIQDVYVDQDILDRMMGLYDVHIASATAASGIEAHIDGVDQASAEGLKNFLLSKVSNAGKNNLQSPPSSTISAGQNQGQVQQTQTQAPTINLTEEISSNTYPLSARWTMVAIIGRIMSSIISPSIIFIFIIASIKNVGILDYWFYILLGWLALSVLTIIVRIITLFLWKKNYTFNFTPENIYYKDGVIAISEKHMPYSSIQDVTVQQGVIERMFGLAKVRIENAAQGQMMPTRRGMVNLFSGVVIQGLSVEDANKITNILKTTVLGKNTSRYGL